MTFQVDGNGENVGVSFNGVGWATTTDIVYEATTNLATSTTLADWVDLVISAGSSYDKLWEVRNALGIVGFVSYTGTPSSARTYRAPYRYYFSSWNYSPKTFYVWKDYDSSNLKVHFFNGTSWYTDTIAANTDHAPSVVEYNSRLHVFWRDRTTGAVKFLFYRYDGYKYGPYDLYSRGIATLGPFDAAVFNGRIYLVYADANTNVRISKCYSASSGCTASNWHEFGPGIYYKTLGFVAYPGMAVESGSGLNGTSSPSTSYLYIASASSTAGANNYRIRIDQVSEDDDLRHTAWMPDNYPSYRTCLEIGMTMMNSAFPDKNYLYLAWNDLDSWKIYKAVVQNYDDVDDSSTWLTRSDDTFLESHRGVRLQKGYGPTGTSVDFAHTDMADYIRYSILYGRY